MAACKYARRSLGKVLVSGQVVVGWVDSERILKVGQVLKVSTKRVVVTTEAAVGGSRQRRKVAPKLESSVVGVFVLGAA